MKILIDIGHPGHVHLFRPFAKEMIVRGHAILFTCREKEFEIQLLESAGFDYVSFGRKYKTTLGKLFGLLKFDVLEISNGLKFKPDMFMSHGSPYAAHAAWFLRKPHVSMEDTGNMEQVRLYLPFTKHVLTSTAFHRNLGEKQIRYSGYHELAYLHPNRFTPNPFIYNELKLKSNDEYVLLRFVSWNASHDVNQSGLTLEEKRFLVALLEKKYKVFISSEQPLPDEFLKYRIDISPHKMHDAMAFAKLFIGEGATMASESAMLGVPAIYINTLTAGTINEQMAYGLVYHLEKTTGLIKKVEELIHSHSDDFIRKRFHMLEHKIDVTAFLVWFIENYPASVRTLKKDPEYSQQFK